MNFGPANFSWNFFKTLKSFIYLRKFTRPSHKTKTIMLATGAAGFVLALQIYAGNEYVWKTFVMPTMHKIDPEKAHKISVKLASYGIIPYILPDSAEMNTYLNTQTMGISFKNPIGLAAGFDKNAICFTNLAKFGFGFIEVGTVTPKYQIGNPKPRMFRLLEYKALINRMGFNNYGIELVRKNIEKKIEKIENGEFKLGVNIGINKTTNDPINDYRLGVNYFKDCCHYIVINVSSPNTPGLRTLQQTNYLNDILEVARKELETQGKRISKKTLNPKLLVKIAPDLTYQEIDSIIDLLLNKPNLVDGIIVSNTSIQRFNLPANQIVLEQGGLSGEPLKDISTDLIKYIYIKSNGKIPIIGSGGVFTGQDAFDKIANGASLIEIYTSLIIEGPIVVNKIKKELVEILKSHNYTNITQAVGCKIKK